MPLYSPVNRRRNDDANAQRHRADHNRQSEVVLINDFLPQVIWRQLVDEEEGNPENDHAQKSEHDGIHHESDVDQISHSLLPCCEDVQSPLATCPSLSPSLMRVS